MVHIPGLAGIDDQADPVRQAFVQQPPIGRSHGQERGDGDALRARVPIGQHDDARLVFERRCRAVLEILDRIGKTHAACGIGGGEPGHRNIIERFDQTEQFLRQDRRVETQALRVVLGGHEEIALHAHVQGERHNHALADRIDRRVRDLGKLLFEVAEEQGRPHCERWKRRVVSHGEDRLFSRGCHDCQGKLHFLGCIPESDLFLGERLARSLIAFPLAVGRRLN